MRLVQAAQLVHGSKSMSSSGRTVTTLTYWYPLSGEAMVEPLASVVVEALRAGKRVSTGASRLLSLRGCAWLAEA